MFLYEIQAYFSENSAIPIAHMISEKHDTETIRQWLTRWNIDIRSQVQEFVSESLALMAAAVISFTQFSSLQRYIEACFKILNGFEFELPLCFIRNDVAHFMKNVSTTWKPLKDLKSTMSRKFFLQSYALLMQSSSLNEARDITNSILIVFGVSPTGGMKMFENVITDERTIVEEKRLQLRKAIAGVPYQISDLANEICNEKSIEKELCQVIL